MPFYKVLHHKSSLRHCNSLDLFLYCCGATFMARFFSVFSKFPFCALNASI